MSAKGSTSRIYKIRNAEGTLVAYHVREDMPDGSKVVRWKRPSGEWGLKGSPLAGLPLYGSELATAYHPDELIVLTEGEKACDALRAVSIPAMGTVTGAGGTPGAEALEVLRDKRVCLWADNDWLGREHMERVAEGLKDVAAELLWFEWDEAPDKGDAADHPATIAKNAKAVDRLLTDLEGAPRWSPPVEKGVGRLLSDVVAEEVSWLWPERIPLGKITVLDGDPGLGKSAVTTDLAARVSAGRPLPDGTPGEAAGVVLCNAEDGLTDTIRPRLDAAGAATERVLALGTVPDGNSERMLSIPEDLDLIRQGIERVRAKLVVVDPLMAFLSSETNSHRDQDVRRALAPLARLAEETGAAVVIVRHLNKSPGGNALYRGGGSIGIVGAARSAMLVAKDPEAERRRVLASLKSNLAPAAASLAFVLTGAANGAVRVEWKGESAHSADALLAASTDPEEKSALEEAVDFIRDELSEFPVAAKQVLKDARDAGLSERTLHRAKKRLGVRSERDADGSWTWVLPKKDGAEKGKNATAPPSGSIGSLGKVAKVAGENSACLSVDCQDCQADAIGPNERLWQERMREEERV